MKITDIKIRKIFTEGPMKAIASVTFDHQLVVHDIKIIYAKEKYFIVMPSRKNPDDTYHTHTHHTYHTHTCTEQPASNLVVKY